MVRRKEEGLRYRALAVLVFVLAVEFATSSPTFPNPTQQKEAPGPVCVASGIRQDCCADGGCSDSQCLRKGCCWDPLNPAPSIQESPFPWCFLPNPPIPGYKISGIVTTPYGLEANLTLLQGDSPFGADITPLQMSVYMETETRLRVKIFDPKNKRWEVPGVIVGGGTPREDMRAPEKPQYQFSYTTSPFGFAVQRVSDGTVLFNTTTKGTSFNGLIFEDQYLEISTQLPNNPNIYGLGEHVHSFRLTPHQYYTIFAADHGGTPVDINLYGSHAFYMDMRSSGNAHGVFLLNSNGMDLFLGDNTLTYRPIGGILDFYFFLGPTPSQVIQQYTDLIGKPYMPLYWSLGWHQCRWGYNTLTDVETVVTQYAKNNIPLEAMWTDIDYMDKYWDFTWDPQRFPQAEVRKFVDKLHANNQHYVVILDCGIANATGYTAWEEGVKRGIFIKDAEGKPFIGKVWPGFTAWPDFLNPLTADYWHDMIKDFIEGVPVDGLWVDMNEIDSFCNGDCPRGSEKTGKKYIAAAVQAEKGEHQSFDPNKPPYPINNGGQRNPLVTTTIPMDALHEGNVLEYNAHSLYGFTEANATRLALERIYKKRAFVIGRSTFPGHGSHANHWLGDNYSSWADLYYSIPGILNFQMFGVPLVGADICGFEGNTTEELCARWMELGVFYPFSRNHNAIGSVPQEPYVWPSVAAISANIIRVRYSLLPYYYTLFYNASLLGETVARPLLFEFPTDPATFSIDQQFLVGPALLISPVLQQGATSVKAYFPGNDVWYDFYTHAPVTKGSPQFLVLDTPLNKIQLHLRGGYIIPIQEPAMTLAEARKNPFTLIVSLSSSGSAVGSLFLDDGESLNTATSGEYGLFEYSASGSILTAKVTKNGWPSADALSLAQVNVLGFPQAPSRLTLNGQPYSKFQYNAAGQEIVVSLNVPINKEWTLQWFM